MFGQADDPSDRQIKMENSSRLVIFSNGLVPDPDRVRALLRSDDHVICADGGTRLALGLGLVPDLIIGDLDSIAMADRSRIEGAGVPIRQYPTDKDQTDLELALNYAVQQEPSAILVIGALGGRLDHTLGNISKLSDSQLAGIDCRIDDGVEEVSLCRKDLNVWGKPGDLVSLIPWGGPVSGIHSDGLRWRLSGDTLQPDRTRGISNEMLAERAVIRIEQGLLLVVHRRGS